MNAVAGAFRYLLVRSTVNRVRRQVRRLRAPRYALGMLGVALYIWFFFYRGGPLAGGSPLRPPLVLPALYETLLAVSIGWLWLLGADEPALAFTGAEVQLLFPAPVTRRALVHYKLVQAQIAIGFSVLIWLLLLSSRSPIAPLLKAIALWVLFTTLYLHRVGASFVRVSAAQQGRRGLRRNWLPLTIAGAAIAAAGWSVARAFPSLVNALENGTIGAALLVLRRAPAIAVVLWPFHALVAPVFAKTTDAWAGAMGWSVVLLLANYLWVVRSGVSFEEAAMQRAERLAAQRAARRTGRFAPIKVTRLWLPLAPTGRPAIAIIWKNTIAFQRIVPIGRIVLVGGALALSIAVMVPDHPLDWSAVRFMALFIAVMLVIFGPIYVRTDLQQDMLMLPLLRSYPLSGPAIVAAEMAGTVAVLLAMQGTLLLIGFPELVRWAGAGRAIPIAIAGVVALPAITALRVAVANGWAVLLPGWVHLGPGRAGGIEALGQRVLALVGSAIAHGLLLILPASVAWVGALFWPPWLGNWAWPCAAAAGAIVAAIELWGLSRWLGGVLHRTDPSEVEAESA